MRRGRCPARAPRRPPSPPFPSPRRHPAPSLAVNTIDPIGYAYAAIIAPQFWCPPGDASCISVVVPTAAGPYPMDRYTYVSTLYGLDYSARWTNLGYLAIFIVVFQFGHLLATKYVRHIVR